MHKVSAPGCTTSLSPPQHTMTAFQKLRGPVSPCSYALGTTPPPPCITPTSGPLQLPRHRSARISAGIQQGEVPWTFWLRVPGSCFAPFSMHGGPSLFTHFGFVEKLFNAPDLSVTKPAPRPSPTHYTFGIISYTGANHAEDLEELGSCERLHNA